MPGGSDVGRDPPVVESEQRSVVSDDAAPSGSAFQLLGVGQKLAIGVEELVVGLPFALDQRVADEQLAGQHGVDPAERDRPGGDEGQAVQGYALQGHRGAALSVQCGSL